jgi:hypothetical protein
MTTTMTTAAFQQETPSQSFQQKSFQVMLDQPVIRQSRYRFGNQLAFLG